MSLRRMITTDWHDIGDRSLRILFLSTNVQMTRLCPLPAIHWLLCPDAAWTRPIHMKRARQLRASPVPLLSLIILLTTWGSCSYSNSSCTPFIPRNRRRPVLICVSYTRITFPLSFTANESSCERYLCKRYCHFMWWHRTQKWHPVKFRLTCR